MLVDVKCLCLGSKPNSCRPPPAADILSRPSSTPILTARDDVIWTESVIAKRHSSQITGTWAWVLHESLSENHAYMKPLANAYTLTFTFLIPSVSKKRNAARHSIYHRALWGCTVTWGNTRQWCPCQVSLKALLWGYTTMTKHQKSILTFRQIQGGCESLC